MNPHFLLPFLAAFLFLGSCGLAADPGTGRIVYQQFTNAFLNDLDGVGVELVLMDADGGNREVIAGSEFFNYGYAALTADGARVAFVAEQGLGGPKLWVMKAEPYDPVDNPAVMLRQNVSAQSRVCWSPNGRRIAFADAFDPQIYVLEAVNGAGAVTPESGSNQAVRVTSLNADARNPAWSPDGRILAYSSGDAIWAVEIQDGAGVLTPESAEDNAAVTVTGGIFIGNDFPAWSPDGTQLIFSSLHPAPPGIPEKSDIAFRTVRQPLAAGGAIIPAFPVGFNDGRVSLFRDQSGGWNPDYVHEAPNYVLEPSWSTDGSRVLYGFRFAGVPVLNTLFSLNPALEDVFTNPSTALTEITSFGTGVPGGRRAAFQPAMLAGGGEVLPAPDNFFIATGESGAPWTFNATLDSDAPGLFLRIQSTLTPEVEGSWTDLPGGGQMSRAGSLWTLLTSVIPAGTRYFRVIAAATGLQDSKTVEPQSYEVISTAGRILYTRGSVMNRELVLMEADGSGKTVLVSGGVFNVQQCALSADGGHAAFTTLAGKLFVMKAEPLNNETNVPVNILEAAEVGPMFGSGITWSPFGPHLAFAGADSRVYVIEVLDDGGNIHPFNGTSVPLVDVGGTLSGAPNPAWSPDGRHLALLGANHIQLLEVADLAGNITASGATNQPVALTLQSDFTSSKTHAAWSPDGQTIAFVERAISGDQAKISLLTAFDAFGTLTPEIAPTQESAGNPRQELHAMTGTPQVKTVSWSPDGALLALETENNGEQRVELIRPAELDGSNPRIALTSQAADGDAFQPAFQQPVSDRALPAVIAFQAPAYAGNEDGDPVIVRVMRAGSASGELEVGFAVTGGSADEGLDYTLTESPLVFADGQTEAQILVTPVPDALDDEGDETVEIELLSTSAGMLGGITSTVVTLNDSDSNAQPFTPAAAELAVAVNGKVLKKGNAKTGDRFTFTVRQDEGALLPGLEVKIQTSATPNDPSSWTNVTGMTLKRATKTSLTWKGSVAATALPQGTVFFRARSYAADRRSNAGPVAGAFKITPAPVLVLTTWVVTDSHPDGLTVKPGEFITYHLRCDNIGAAPAKKVVLNSLIPAQTRLGSASHDNAAFPGYFKRILGTRGTSKGVVTDVQWNVGDIQAGQHASEFVTVQVNQEVEFARLVLNNRLTYKGTGVKEFFTPSLATQIESPLLLTLTRDKNIVQAGDLITYTLIAKNDASYQITGGQVRSQIPDGTRLYSANQGDGAGNYLGTALAHTLLEESPQSMTRPGYTLHNRTLLWNIGTLPGGSQRQLRYTVRVAYDLFDKIARNGESFNTEIRNVNFDFTGTPPSGGVIAAYNGFVPSDRITRNPVSAETPAQRPELGLVKKAVSDTVVTVGRKEEAAAVLADEWRRITYKIEASNYGNITAEDTVIYDVLPLGTDFDMDLSLSGSEATDTFTTDEPHGFTAGEKIIFTSLNLTGGKGLAVNKIYFVSSVPSADTFTVSATAGGPVLNFSTDVTVGDARRLAYDWPRFMSRFTLDGAPFAFPDGFKFFDETGAVILPGGEAYVDTNGNGKVDKGEFIDGNGNGKYDGPEKVRSFEFRLGHLAQMTRPAVRTLTYRVKVRPTVKTGTQITAFGSSSVKRGEGLELVSPDFIYPLSGTPELLHTRVVSRMTWLMEPPHPLDAGYVTDDPLLRAVPHLIRFRNTSSDLYALDAKLRIPVPQGFEVTAPGGSLQKFDAKLDAKLDKSPGTFVLNIGEVAPGQQIERQITSRFQPPMPAGWTDKKGVLLQTQAFSHASVVSTRVSSEPPSSGFSLLSTGASTPRFEIKFDARAASVSALPVMKTNTDPRVFVGRIAPAAVQAGTEMDVFIFYGNHGGVRTDNGEIAMQIPWGTRLASAEPICYNPDEGNSNQTQGFSRGFFTIKTEKGPKRRPQDGEAGVVFFKFGNMAPAEVGVVRVRFFVTQDFPMGFITDQSLYIKFDGVAGKSPPPLSVQVLRNTNGATDWWQATSNFFDKLGSEINTALRNLFGQGGGEFRFDQAVITLGGADFVHLANGGIIIPLGRSRSAVIAKYDAMVNRMPFSSFMLHAETRAYLGMAAGTTSSQQLFVPGSIQQDRSVQNILAELTSPSSIVAGGGGNIVAAGGGNIVAGGGGNIVAGGGGNVVANDGAGFLPGSITFSIPGVNPGIVAAGGGNIVAAGGGNIVAAGGGNIVAAGGGNIVAAGGGNLISVDGLKYDISKMGALITKLPLIDPAKLLDPANVKLIGQDGAGVVANDGAGLIGQDGAGLVGQDGAGFSQ